MSTLAVGVVLPGAVQAQAGVGPVGAGAVPLSLQTAVRLAQDTSAQGILAGLRTEQARTQLETARAVFFPDITGNASFVRRTINAASFGLTLPGIPTKIGPFN